MLRVQRIAQPMHKLLALSPWCHTSLPEKRNHGDRSDRSAAIAACASGCEMGTRGTLQTAVAITYYVTRLRSIMAHARLNRPDRETGNRPTNCPALPGLFHLPLHHIQCRLFPSQSLPSQRTRFLQRTSPLPSIRLPQLNIHRNRFLSQAPTSPDRSLARQGLLRPQTMFKVRGLVMVEVAGAEVQCSLLSSPHHRLGCVRTTHSPARPCIPARAQRLLSPTLHRRRTAAVTESPLPLLLTLFRATAATTIDH